MIERSVGYNRFTSAWIRGISNRLPIKIEPQIMTIHSFCSIVSSGLDSRSRSCTRSLDFLPRGRDGTLDFLRVGNSPGISRAWIPVPDIPSRIWSRGEIFPCDASSFSAPRVKGPVISKACSRYKLDMRHYSFRVSEQERWIWNGKDGSIVPDPFISIERQLA